MAPIQDGSASHAPWEEEPRAARLRGPLFRDEPADGALKRAPRNAGGAEPDSARTVMMPLIGGAPEESESERSVVGLDSLLNGGQPQGPRPRRRSVAGAQEPGADAAPRRGAARHTSPQAAVAGSGAGGSEDGAGQPRRRERGGRNLPAAIGVGLGLGAVLLLALFIVKVLFLGVVVAAAGVGLWELSSRLSEKKRIRPPLIPMVLGGTGMQIAAYFGGIDALFVAFAVTVLAILAWRMLERPEGYLPDVTAGVFCVFYVPFLAGFVPLMLTADDGAWRVTLFLMLAVCSDTAGYAVGYRFGRRSRKLAPSISPGKTRVGFGGSVGGSALVGAIAMPLMIDGGVWWQGALLGVVAAVTATVGDLTESMIKRDLGVKDMGDLLPGHGGLMDRLDSLLPTAAVTWLLLSAFVGSGL
ncbi:phosphatidate cytidylyltransferase [Allostreptomyces psammosilenae]|nr:phosphatidate cytidylyltransferase [Allostreptomyces psammosilenae]